MVHNTKLKKRIWSLLLCLCMVLSCLPVSVFSESDTTVAEAKWGTDKNNLTGSGTLAEALAAVKNDSTMKYICLNKSWTATGTNETQYTIEGIGITFDLNGKTVSGPLRLRVESGSVTFTDSVGGGKWENTYANSYAVYVKDAEVTFTGGSYKGGDAVRINEGTAVIKGGTFIGDYYAISNSEGTVTIEGGVFSGRFGVSSGISSRSTTVTGGDFSQCSWDFARYNGGVLNLSGYPTTTVAGTTPIAKLMVWSVSSDAVTVGTGIELPDGYGFYKMDDTAQTIVDELVYDTHYSIKDTGVMTPEAKWGKDKSDLTGSGTLEEAVAAAKNDSTVKYICLNKRWMATGTDVTHYYIEGDGITFDLNGKTVSGPLCLRASSGSVTFTDSLGGGQWENTTGGSDAVIVDSATATFISGSYKGGSAVYMSSSSGVAVIKGGTFTGTSNYAISNSFGTLTVKKGAFNGACGVYSGSRSKSTTITGGDFSGCTAQSVEYWGGTLDLSGYPITATTGTTPLTDLTIRNQADTAVAVGTAIKPPASYGFYQSDDASKVTVTELAASANYAIKYTDAMAPEAKWGTTKGNLTGSGTLEEAMAALKNDSTIKYVQLNKSWISTGTTLDYYRIRGEGITFDLNGKTVSAPLCLRANTGSVTFIDSVGGGIWENTASGGYAVIVDDATATFTGGLYKGNCAVEISYGTAKIEGGTFVGDYVISNGLGTMIVEGGIFIGAEYGVSVGGSSKSTTIKGGDFSQCSRFARYNGSVLDLSGYPTTTVAGTTPISKLTIWNISHATVTVGTDIKLPKDCDFYKVGDTTQTIVTTLADDNYYTIKAPCPHECNMAEYFHGNNGVSEKLRSADWDFERRNGELYGCITVQTGGPLTEEEEQDLKDWISGQNSDGLGEGFEQREICFDGSRYGAFMYVSLWHSGDDYYIDNEDEFEDRLASQAMTIGGI